jgi:uncharacterized protein (DUF433 family)
MTLVVTPQSPPLRTDADGVVRVGGTRVTLETVVGAFHDGATAEEIVQQYPSLALADVYAVISYYLNERAAVDAYLRQERERSEQVRKQNERHFDPTGVRERLLARRRTAA